MIVSIFSALCSACDRHSILVDHRCEDIILGPICISLFLSFVPSLHVQDSSKPQSMVWSPGVPSAFQEVHGVKAF